MMVSSCQLLLWWSNEG